MLTDLSKAEENHRNTWPICGCFKKWKLMESSQGN